MNKILRFGVSIDEGLLTKFDSLISDKGYMNRSEAIRDLIRDMIEDTEITDPDTGTIGTLTFIYNHHTREISDRLNDIQHKYFKNIISANHIHLDQHNCLEVLILKGKAKDVQAIADRLISVKNVQYGKLTMTAAESINTYCVGKNAQ